MAYFQDTGLFFFLTVPFIYGLTISPSFVWVIIIVLVLALCGMGVTGKLEKRWLNWFEISKLFAGLGGLISMNLFRSGFFVSFSIPVTTIILLINIFEAVGQDVQIFYRKPGQWGHLWNAFSGLALAGIVPFVVLGKPLVLDDQALFLFPLPIYWIVLYTLWSDHSLNRNMSHRIPFFPQERHLLLWI
jgi:hypothetical protein